MDRRRKWLLGLFGLVAAVAVIVSACGGGGATATPAPKPTNTPAPTQAPTRAPTAAPPATPTPVPTAPAPTATPAPSVQFKRGGILRLRLNNDPQNLTPDTYHSAGGSSVSYMMPLMSNFVVENPYKPGAVIGDVASAWSISSDGTVWTFKMKDNVRYTDGKPVTADEVVWNFNQGWKPQAPGISNTQSVWKFVTDIKAVDPVTVQITLKQPSASFLTSLGQSAVLLYPRHILGDKRDLTVFKQAPVGSGPYFRSDYKPGSTWQVRKNPGYYGKDAAGNQLPYLDGIDYFVITDFAATQAAIRTGQVDLATVFDAPIITDIQDALAKDRGFEFFGGAGTRIELTLRNKPPWDNKKVRQAISMGFDRKLFFDVVDKGRGTFLASPMVPVSQGGVWGLPEEELRQLPGFRQPHQADFEEARRILRAEGVKEGTPLLYSVFVFFANTGAADVVVTQLKNLGFDAKAAIATSGPEIIQRLMEGNFDVYHGSAPVSFDDPSQAITPFFGTGQGRNFGNFSNPKLDRLLEEQDRTLDFTKRRDLIYQIQREILDQATNIPVDYGQSKYGWPAFVKNHPKWVFAFGTQWRYEQVWLDK